MSELFDLPPSEPPRLDRLRREYEQACLDLYAAEEWQDETGEPVPRDLYRRRDDAQMALWGEEARLTK